MHMLHSSISEYAIVHLQHLPIFIRDRAASPASEPDRSEQDRRGCLTVLRTIMAYYTGNRTQTTTLLQRLNDIRTSAVEAYGNWRVYHITLNELRDLSMREMTDLGINPTMIKRIALEAAYGKNV